MLRGLFLDSMARQIPKNCSKGLLGDSSSQKSSGHSCQTAAAGSSDTEYDKLHAILKGVVSPQRLLFLTGHSLGGATAALFAMGLAARLSV